MTTMPAPIGECVDVLQERLPEQVQDMHLGDSFTLSIEYWAGALDDWLQISLQCLEERSLRGSNTAQRPKLRCVGIPHPRQRQGREAL